MESKIDAVIAGWGLKADKKGMFGGKCWLLSGNTMCAMLAGEVIILRVPDHLRQSVLANDYAYPAEMNGRTMKNWVMFEGRTLPDLEFTSLLEIGRDFALSLPVK